MKKLLIIFLLFTGSFSLTAQLGYRDSMYYPIDRLLLQFEHRLEGITPAQSTAIRTAVQPIMKRAEGQKLTKPQRMKMRQQLRQAIVGELTPAQVEQLKALRKDSGDLIDRTLFGERGVRRKPE